MIYSEIIKSKNGLDVPVFKSGKLSASKYDPEKEAENFVKTINDSSFFMVLGLAGGFHIKKLSETFPSSKILVVETDDESINFLKEHCPLVHSLLQNNNIIFSSINNIKKNLLENYLPVIYKKFTAIEYRPWSNENSSYSEIIKEAVNEALNEISSDYATQSHFGKIWQHNIIKNLKNYRPFSLNNIDTSKTAAVIAAGPSLNSKIQYLKENKSSLYIISTDTAYPVLKKNKIKSDAVVSIDAQFVSHSHFKIKPDSSTSFIFDLTANPSSVRKILKNGNNIIFTTSSHPLVLYSEFLLKKNCFMKLNAGSGTVTISALDFAFQAGFSNIMVFGADFSYVEGKSYASGTYLDSIYLETSKKIRSFETNFCKLMFRSHLLELTENHKTTKILTAYRESFLQYLKNNCKNYSYNDAVYHINTDSKQIPAFENFDYQKFVDNLNKNLQTINIPQRFTPELLENPLIISLLPYCAFENEKNSSSFMTSLKLALNDIKRYT